MCSNTLLVISLRAVSLTTSNPRRKYKATKH